MSHGKQTSFVGIRETTPPLAPLLAFSWILQPNTQDHTNQPASPAISMKKQNSHSLLPPPLFASAVLSYCVPMDADYQAAFESQYGAAFNGSLSGSPSNYLTDLAGDFMTARSVILGFGVGIAAVRILWSNCFESF